MTVIISNSFSIFRPEINFPFYDGSIFKFDLNIFNFHRSDMFIPHLSIPFIPCYDAHIAISFFVCKRLDFACCQTN